MLLRISNLVKLIPWARNSTLMLTTISSAPVNTRSQNAFQTQCSFKQLAVQTRSSKAFSEIFERWRTIKGLPGGTLEAVFPATKLVGTCNAYLIRNSVGCACWKDRRLHRSSRSSQRQCMPVAAAAGMESTS